MNQQEIKAGMSNLPWKQKGTHSRTSGHGMSDEELEIVDNKGFGSSDQRICSVSDVWNRTKQTSNAAAIVSAVNNTYGKGFNPEKVEEMYEMLTRIYNQGGIDGDFRELQSLLTTSKL